MKAENILNSNLTWKSRICYIKVGGNQFFMISPNFRRDFFFRNENFSKFFINNPQFFFHPHVHKITNYKYIDFYTPTLTTDKVTSISKRYGCLAPPSTFLRVKGQVVFFCWTKMLKSFFSEFLKLRNLWPVHKSLNFCPISLLVFYWVS